MKAVRFLGGLMLGVALGWFIGTFLAPKSGQDTRQALRDRVNQVAEEGRHAAVVVPAEHEAHDAQHVRNRHDTRADRLHPPSLTRV